MDHRLSKLIFDFLAKVSEAVDMLEEAGIPRPTSNIQWASPSFAPGRGPLANGFNYFKHGFGCYVYGPEWNVDFDFSDDGRTNWFDVWRLHRFAGKRLPDYGFESMEEIELAARDAAEAGELRHTGHSSYFLAEPHLPYDPTRALSIGKEDSRSED